MGGKVFPPNIWCSCMYVRLELKTFDYVSWFTRLVVGIWTYGIWLYVLYYMMTNWGDLEGNKMSTSIQFLLMFYASIIVIFLFPLHQIGILSDVLHWLSYSSFECVKLKRTGFFSRRHSMPWFIFWSWGVLLYAKLVLSHAMLIYLRFLDCSTYHVMETSSSDNCDNIMIIHPSPPLGRTFDVPITSKSFASLHIKNQISK